MKMVICALFPKACVKTVERERLQLQLLLLVVHRQIGSQRARRVGSKAGSKKSERNKKGKKNEQRDLGFCLSDQHNGRVKTTGIGGAMEIS